MTVQLVTGSIVGLMCMGMIGEALYVVYRLCTRNKG